MIPATMQNYQERKAKLDDHMREIQLLFKKLRVVYTKVGNSCIPYDTKPIEVRHNSVKDKCNGFFKKSCLFICSQLYKHTSSDTTGYLINY